MGLDIFPDNILDNYEVYEWKHACAILKNDFPDEFKDLVDVLQRFSLKKSYISQSGGSKSLVTKAIDSELYKKGWLEKKFITKIVVDSMEIDSPTHLVDCFKNGIALEVEWNNKDPFFDRDLNNFRLLFEMRVVNLGIIITRSDELQKIFKILGRGKSYGASTTHMSKLLSKINGGGGAGCPILVFGITKKLYDSEN
ncbi:MAG: BglII/BstYI family type II restriction endonuclease [bacterium]